eukprot:PhF_6_TR23981/c0_g1_i2/m.33582
MPPKKRPAEDVDDVTPLKAVPTAIATIPNKPIRRVSKTHREHVYVPGKPYGTGTLQDPICIPLRDSPNSCGCMHCPLGVESCQCIEMFDIIWTAIAKVSAVHPRVCGHREKNSKSILPVFVSRLIRLFGLGLDGEKNKDDVFWDLGCGNGSVVMQVALQSGCRCVGVEYIPENITLAEAAWPLVKKEYLKRYPTATVGDVTFIAADMFPTMEEVISNQAKKTTKKSTSQEVLPAPTVVWVANLLMEPLTNQRIANTLLQFPSLRGVAAFKDLYPHTRSTYKRRHPEAYEKFDEMIDHRFQEGSVEWSEIDQEPFYTYRTTQR